jgi:hypothetical protein
METLFNDYINKQVDKEDKEPSKPQYRKVPYKSNNNLANKYTQSLVVDKSLTSLKRNQKRIKLASKLNRYYNAGLKLIKNRSNNGNKRNNVVPDPLNWWLKIG